MLFTEEGELQVHWFGRCGLGHRPAPLRWLLVTLPVRFEIRQDLVDTRRGAAEWAGTLAAALGPLLEDPALHRIEHY